MTRLWDKGSPVDSAILHFTVGDDWILDQRLVAHDVRASVAHARMLAKQGLLSAADAEAIARTLDELGAAHARGEWAIAREEEDAHTALEARLVAKLGEAGKRVHLGRSRNDQVLTAMRLWLREEITTLAVMVDALAEAADALARRESSVLLPGYTHMQRAMPSSVGLWAGGFATEFRDDAASLRRLLERVATCPLGSAAGYGVPFLPLDREATSRELGFDGAQEPVTACQLSRGKAEASFAFEASLLLQDIGRMASDLCLYATSEFAFVRLPQEFTTGSSIMPQKRNPDAAELARGKSGRVIGALVALLVVMKGLPLAYSKDMQEDKEGAFDALDTLSLCVAAIAGMVRDMRVDRARMKAAAGAGYATATDLADWLVRALSLPFREAHHVTGRIVALAEARGADLEELTLGEMRSVETRINAEVFDVLGVEKSVQSRKSFGGAAPDNVRAAAQAWLDRLKAE